MAATFAKSATNIIFWKEQLVVELVCFFKFISYLQLIQTFSYLDVPSEVAEGKKPHAPESDFVVRKQIAAAQRGG